MSLGGPTLTFVLNYPEGKQGLDAERVKPLSLCRKFTTRVPNNLHAPGALSLSSVQFDTSKRRLSCPEVDRGKSPRLPTWQYARTSIDVPKFQTEGP